MSEDELDENTQAILDNDGTNKEGEPNTRNKVGEKRNMTAPRKGPKKS